MLCFQNCSTRNGELFCSAAWRSCSIMHQELLPETAQFPCLAVLYHDEAKDWCNIVGLTLWNIPWESTGVFGRQNQVLLISSKPGRCQEIGQQSWLVHSRLCKSLICIWYRFPPQENDGIKVAKQRVKHCQPDLRWRQPALKDMPLSTETPCQKDLENQFLLLSCKLQISILRHTTPLLLHIWKDSCLEQQHSPHMPIYAFHSFCRRSRSVQSRPKEVNQRLMISEQHDLVRSADLYGLNGSFS